MLRSAVKLARPSLLQLGNAKFYQQRVNVRFHPRTPSSAGRATSRSTAAALPRSGAAPAQREPHAEKESPFGETSASRAAERGCGGVREAKTFNGRKNKETDG